MNYLDYVNSQVPMMGGGNVIASLWDKAKQKISGGASDENNWGDSTEEQIANAKKFGFKSIDDVRSYQLQNGLGSDGKIDTNGRTMRALNKKGTSKAVPQVTASGKSTNSQEFNISNVSNEQLLRTYQNANSGKLSAGAALGLYVIAPFLPIFHNRGTKQQVAAAIAYNENNPNARQADPSLQKKSTKTGALNLNKQGYKYIGYKTYGTLSGQGSNANQQTANNNGAGKIMGGMRYKKNDDGSYDVFDSYGFGIIRDFSNYDDKKKSYATYSVDDKKYVDPYANSRWKGLWHDVKTLGLKNIVTNPKLLEQVGENMGTRTNTQYGRANNSFTLSARDMERYLS